MIDSSVWTLGGSNMRRNSTPWFSISFTKSMMIGQISAELQPTSHEGDPLPSLFDFLKAPFILAANGDRAINQPEMNEGR